MGLSDKSIDYSVPNPDELVRLVSQQTIDESDGQTIERWGLEVWSSHPVVARNRARRWTRQKVPNARNVFSPSTDNTEQSTFGDFFDIVSDPKYRDVELVVVKPFAVE